MLVLLSLLTACSASSSGTPGDAPQEMAEAEAPEATPAPSGLAVGVVLPAVPRLDGRDAPYGLDVDALERELAPEVRRIRSHVPEDPTFVHDLVLAMSERGIDIICAFGGEGVEAVLAAMELHPELRYCAAPVADPASLPDGVDGIEVRGRELGYVVGVAARAAARDAPVGLLLGDDPSHLPGFREGVLVGLADAEVVMPSGEARDTAGAAEELLAVGVDVIVAAGPRAAVAVEAVAGRARLLAPEPALDGTGTQDPSVVMSWRLRWEAAVLGPALRHLTRHSPLQASVGFAEDAFETDVTASEPRLGVVTRGAIEAITSGRADLAPGAGKGPPDVSPPERAPSGSVDEPSDGVDEAAGIRPST